MLNNDQRIANLYEVLKSYTNNVAEVKECQKILNMNVNNQTIIRELTGAIYNGVAFGNWPWSVNVTTKIR